MNIINNIKGKYEILIDNRGIHIINYIQIMNISYLEISILVSEKILKIRGKSLIIKKLDEKELIISGIIEGIDFVEK